MRVIPGVRLSSYPVDIRGPPTTILMLRLNPVLSRYIINNLDSQTNYSIEGGRDKGNGKKCYDAFSFVSV